MTNFSTDSTIETFFEKGDNKCFSYLDLLRLKAFILINF